MIDMPGASEVKSAEVAFTSDGKIEIPLEHEFDLNGDASEVRSELKRALETTTNPEDSEVQLFLMGTSPDGGKPRELGVARLSLETMLSSNKEHDGPLQLTEQSGSKKTIGTIACTVKGLPALTLISDEIAGKGGADGTGRDEGKRYTIDATIHSVDVLNKRRAPHAVQLWLEMPGHKDRVPSEAVVLGSRGDDR